MQICSKKKPRLQMLVRESMSYDDSSTTLSFNNNFPMLYLQKGC